MFSFIFPDIDELDEVFESILTNIRLGTANVSDWESLAAANRIPNDLPSHLMSMCPEHLRPASWTEPPEEPYAIEWIEGIEEIDEWDIESCRLPLVYDFSEPETCVEEAADLVLWQQKEVERQETYETLRESWYASLGPENGIRAKVWRLISGTPRTGNADRVQKFREYKEENMTSFGNGYSLLSQVHSVDDANSDDDRVPAMAVSLFEMPFRGHD